MPDGLAVNSDRDRENTVMYVSKTPSFYIYNSKVGKSIFAWREVAHSGI